MHTCEHVPVVLVTLWSQETICTFMGSRHRENFSRLSFFRMKVHFWHGFWGLVNTLTIMFSSLWLIVIGSTQFICPTIPSFGLIFGGWCLNVSVKSCSWGPGICSVIISEGSFPFILCSSGADNGAYFLVFLHLNSSKLGKNNDDFC